GGGNDLLGHRGPARPAANILPSGARGLVLSRAVAARGICDAGAIRSGGAVPRARGVVRRRGSLAVVALQRYPQRLGHGRVLRLHESGEGPGPGPVSAASGATPPVHRRKGALISYRPSSLSPG